jgi:hypothetical protein
VEKDFRVVDAEIARVSAELRSKYKVSMADSVIAATALVLKAILYSEVALILRPILLNYYFPSIILVLNRNTGLKI